MKSFKLNFIIHDIEIAYLQYAVAFYLTQLDLKMWKKFSETFLLSSSKLPSRFN